MKRLPQNEDSRFSCVLMSKLFGATHSNFNSMDNASKNKSMTAAQPLNQYDEF
jgi:hypothetical protein